MLVPVVTSKPQIGTIKSRLVRVQKSKSRVGDFSNSPNLDEEGGGTRVHFLPALTLWLAICA